MPSTNTAAARKISPVIFSSNESDWETPPGLFAQLDRRWGPFDLDAAADEHNTKCSIFIGKTADALKQQWHLAGSRIWLNPPYGRDIGRWIAKALDESLKGCRVVLLLPSRTDTAWFHELVRPHAFHVEFLRGRVRFVGANNCAPFPSMVVVFEFGGDGR